MSGVEATAADRSGPFVGIRVLDLGSDIAAPYAAMFLGDQGADVVKVESEAGDPYRSDPGFQTINRNKRSVVADPDRLIPAADVVFIDEPGRVPSVRRLNPDAVIVTMPPWGERGPKVEDDFSRTVMHAATGIAWNQQAYGEVPVDIVVPIAAYGTGVLGALAAASGLLHRARTGVGPTYEASQVAGAAAIQLGEYRLAGDDEPRLAESPLGSKGRVACYRLVEAGDGQWFFLACLTERFYRRMLDVIGHPELMDDPLLANPPWGLLTNEAVERFTPILEAALATRSRAEWLELFAAADVPAQPVLTRAEFLQTSLVAENEMDVTVDHPERGPIRMMGLPVTVEGTPGAISRPAPVLGQHTDEVLAEWSSEGSEGNIPGLPAADSAGSGGPLTGLRVIDLASFIAGPVISRHLGMLGADVIKVEPPAGDQFRPAGPLFHSFNHAKRGIALDLTTEAGRAALHRLVAEADVVVENFRPGVSERLGCDRETLRRLNPNLVFLSSPGYGIDPSWADKPAFDPLVQALGGFMAAQGGIRTPGDGAEPVFLTVPIHDVMTPMIGAFGAVVGLWQRSRAIEAGQAGFQSVRTSLIQSTMASQVAEFTRFEGREDPVVGGFDHPGTSGNSWAETDGGFEWHDGDRSVAVETHGLTASELASANDLVMWEETAAFGRLLVYGQLIGGAGPHPARAPELNEHEAEIRAEFGLDLDRDLDSQSKSSS